MANILNTTQVYNAADVVTHTNLNQIISGASFVTGTGGTTDDITLEVDASGGFLQVKEIDSAQLKDDSVTTPKILDSNVTKEKLEDISGPLKVLGRTTAGAGAPEEVTINNDVDLTTASDITLATDESIKNFIDKLKPNISQTIHTDTFVSEDTNTWLDFDFEVSITPRFGNSNLRYGCALSNDSNNGNHAGHFRLLRRVGPASDPPVPEDFTVVEDAIGPIRGLRTRASFSGTAHGAYGVPLSTFDFIDTDVFNAGVEVTYKLQGWMHTNTKFYINRSSSDTSAAYNVSPISTCIAEEIFQ